MKGLIIFRHKFFFWNEVFCVLTISGATTALFREIHYAFLHMRPPQYRETPSMASCPGCPRRIILSTACCNFTGTASLLSTRMQSSFNAICDHRGLVYGHISSSLCLSPRSITRLSRSNQVSSDVSSARNLLSKSFERLSNVSSGGCLCSFCSSRDLCF